MALTEDEFQDKAVSYGFVVKSFDDITTAIENEIARLQVLKGNQLSGAKPLKAAWMRL
ncbi:hypothetical protein [Paraflavitalea speifideaquila]|uniref:hypothetical protein n=1 Tax=Paraflavitalea speifideaquila TaxID=3076558 RepID=UPI003312FDAA